MTAFSLRRNYHRSGFTLIELMLAIAIIAIIATIVIAAINPSRQLAQTQNTQRQQNINTILNAMYQYSLDAGGKFQDETTPLPTDCTIPLLPASPRKMCLASVDAAHCDFGNPDDGEGCIYSAFLIPKYVTAIPTDPQDAVGGTEDLQSDYTAVMVDDAKRLRIIAPNTNVPPADAVFSVQR